MATRKKFVSPDGDHLTMLNIYRAYKSFNGSKVVTLEILPKNKQGRITGIVYAPKS